MNTQQNKSKTRWGKILVVGAVVIFIFIALYSFFQILKTKQIEKKINQEFHREIINIPQLQVTSFKLWERDSIVQATVADKGKMVFWYGRDGVPRINSIGSYSTSYDCFILSNGRKTGYAFSMNLVLNEESKFHKWFPFEVNTLKDLVDRYDAIIDILRTFPQKPIMVSFTDISGVRQVVQNPNPEYVLLEQSRGKEVACDLFE